MSNKTGRSEQVLNKKTTSIQPTQQSTNFRNDNSQNIYKIQNIQEVILDLWAEDERECYLSPVWNALKSLLNDKYFGRFQWFPVVYRSVLALSIFGSWYSLVELVTVVWGTENRPSILRRQKYQCRLVGSLVMLSSWLLLWYSLINVSLDHMKLWITINAFMLFYELIIWIIEIFHGTRKVDVRQLVTFVLPVANLLFVCCVRSELQRIANA